MDFWGKKAKSKNNPGGMDEELTICRKGPASDFYPGSSHVGAETKHSCSADCAKSGQMMTLEKSHKIKLLAEKARSESTAGDIMVDLT